MKRVRFRTKKCPFCKKGVRYILSALPKECPYCKRTLLVRYKAKLGNQLVEGYRNVFEPGGTPG